MALMVSWRGHLHSTLRHLQYLLYCHPIAMLLSPGKPPHSEHFEQHSAGPNRYKIWHCFCCSDSSPQWTNKSCSSFFPSWNLSSGLVGEKLNSVEVHFQHLWQWNITFQMQQYLFGTQTLPVLPRLQSIFPCWLPTKGFLCSLKRLRLRRVYFVAVVQNIKAKSVIKLFLIAIVFPHE